MSILNNKQRKRSNIERLAMDVLTGAFMLSVAGFVVIVAMAVQS